MSVAVIVPFNRGSGEPAFASTPALRRESALGLVRSYYEDAHPNWPLKIARSGWKIGSKRWSKAVAVNTAVKALPANVDVLVLNDADTICLPEQVIEAVRLAAEAPGLVFAYTFYHRLSLAATRACRQWQDVLVPADVQQTIMNAASHGCIAIRRADFDQLGGLDERFAGWGPEDIEFNERAARHWPIRRVEGHAFHLFHGERNPDDSPAGTRPEIVQANYATLANIRAGLA